MLGNSPPSAIPGTLARTTRLRTMFFQLRIPAHVRIVDQTPGEPIIPGRGKHRIKRADATIATWSGLVGSEACLRSEVPPEHNGFTSRSHRLRAGLLGRVCKIAGRGVSFLQQRVENPARNHPLLSRPRIGVRGRNLSSIAFADCSVQSPTEKQAYWTIFPNSVADLQRQSHQPPDQDTSGDQRPRLPETGDESQVG